MTTPHRPEIELPYLSLSPAKSRKTDHPESPTSPAGESPADASAVVPTPPVHFWHDEHLCHDPEFWHRGQNNVLPKNVLVSGFPDSLQPALPPSILTPHEFTSSTHNVNGFYSLHRTWNVYIKFEGAVERGPNPNIAATTPKDGRGNGRTKTAAASFSPAPRSSPAKANAQASRPSKNAKAALDEVDAKEAEADTEEGGSPPESFLCLQWCSEQLGTWVLHEVPAHALNEDGSYAPDKDEADDRFFAFVFDPLFSCFGTAPRQLLGRRGLRWDEGRARFVEVEKNVELVFGSLVGSEGGRAGRGGGSSDEEKLESEDHHERGLPVAMRQSTTKKSRDKHITASSFDFVEGVFAAGGASSSAPSSTLTTKPVFCRQPGWNLLVRLARSLGDASMLLTTATLDPVGRGVDAVSSLLFVNKTAATKFSRSFKSASKDSMSGKSQNLIDGRVLAAHGDDDLSTNLEMSHKALLQALNLGGSGIRQASLENQFRAVAVVVDANELEHRCQRLRPGEKVSEYKLHLGPTLFKHKFVSML